MSDLDGSWSGFSSFDNIDAPCVCRSEKSTRGNSKDIFAFPQNDSYVHAVIVAEILGDLVEINDHIEKVIQMYLRNEYSNLTEYNEQAGMIAEKYRLLLFSRARNAIRSSVEKAGNS